jgi:hypothetical protein
VIKYIVLFLVVIGIAGFTGLQYVDQFGWTISHVDARAATWGAFGDYIGGVMNPIVAGIGLIFFIITLKQNEKALNMSAEELKLTRKELKEASAAQKELASIERENLQNTRLIRDYESCQKAESIISMTLDIIMAESVEIPWTSFVDAHTTFNLNRMINGHGTTFVFKVQEGESDLEMLQPVVARYIGQLDNLYKIFERQNKLSKELNILYVSKLKDDVEKFNNRMLNASSRTFYQEPSLLIENPVFQELLGKYSKFVEDNSKVLT